jgi:glycosyltransferase 2 family protein
VNLRNLSWRRLLLLFLALALLGWVARTISIRAALATLAQLRARDLLLLAAVNLLLLATFSGRWWLLLQAQGEHVPYWRLLGYRLTAFGISYFTPGAHFGGEPYQIYAVSRWHGAPAPVSIAAVTLDKLLEMLINFAVLTGGVLVLFMTQGGLAPWLKQQLALYALLLLAIPFGLLVALWLGRHPLTGMVAFGGKLLRRPLAKHTWFEALRQSETQAIWLCRHHPRALGLALLVSILIWVGVVGEFWLLTWMLGLSLSPLQAMTSLIAARIAILLPVPAALGALEASQVLAMESLGIDPSVGIAIADVIRARDVVLGLLGLALGGTHIWQKPAAATARPISEIATVQPLSEIATPQPTSEG